MTYMPSISFTVHLFLTVITSCYGNGSDSPHRRGVTPLLRSARPAGAKTGRVHYPGGGGYMSL